MELYNTRSWYMLAAAIVVSIIISLNLGWFTKFAVERFGEKVLGTNVSIGKLSVDTKEGLAIAQDIKISNPSAYKKYEPYALTIEKVTIDTKALKKGLVIFEQASVEGVDVYLVADEKNSNFAIFRDNVKKYMDAYMADYDEDDLSGPDVIVDKVNLAKINFHP